MGCFPCGVCSEEEEEPDLSVQTIALDPEHFRWADCTTSASALLQLPWDLVGVVLSFSAVGEQACLSQTCRRAAGWVAQFRLELAKHCWEGLLGSGRSRKEAVEGVVREVCLCVASFLCFVLWCFVRNTQQ